MPGSLEEISWKNELTILLIFVKVTLISNINCMFFTINFHLLNIFESSVKVKKIKWNRRLHGEVEVMVISMMVIRFLQLKVEFEEAKVMSNGTGGGDGDDSFSSCISGVITNFLL